MPKVCILTDSTAQFSNLIFPGHELVSIIPLHVMLNEQMYTDGKDLRAASLPASARNSSGPRVLAPTPDEFLHYFITLGQKYHEIVVILISSHLSPVVANAHEAAASGKGPAIIHVIDSQTTAVGLGLLVQIAARAAQNDEPGARINRIVRGVIPRIYSVFCVQNLTYLYRSGHLDPAQAIIGEMLGVTPFFILENGRLVPIQKVRNPRHLVDLLHEFITEFTDLQHIALVQGVPPYEQEVRNLKERLNGDYPATSFSEHTLGAALATILGPHSLGLFAMENCSEY
jgi:DegV family protein with EDD domain